MVDGLDRIRSEHRNMDRVLGALEELVAALPGAEAKPDLELLYAAVYYIRVFPDKFHHPKEENYLFQILRNRRPDTAALLDELERQHHEGARLIDDLSRALQTYDRTFPDGLDALREAVTVYVAAQRRHIGLEERDVLPAAEEALAPAEREALDRAFASHSDPLFGDNLEAGFAALLQRITGSH